MSSLRSQLFFSSAMLCHIDTGSNHVVMSYRNDAKLSDILLTNYNDPKLSDILQTNHNDPKLKK